MIDTEINDMAEAHYVYVESVCHKMYVDAFIHGFGHGIEYAENKHGGAGK